MTKSGVLGLVMMLAPAIAFGVDGQTLINQSTVMASGGFPFKITQPGSYKLTGNLNAPAGVNGIEISTSYVTLDLNGFGVFGPAQVCAGPGSCNTLLGILVANSQQNVTIRNGTIVGFGTQISMFATTRGLAEDLILSGVPGGNQNGVSNFGQYSVVRHVVTDDELSLHCPTVAVENVSPLGFFRLGTPSDCVLSNNSGPVF